MKLVVCVVIDKHMDSVDVNVDVNVIGHRIQALEGNNMERRLRVAT